MEPKALAKRTNYLVMIVVLIYLVSQLIIQYLMGEAWIDRNLYLLLAFIQLFIILLPALLFVQQHDLKLSVVFRIRKLSLPEALLIILMAVASSFVASILNTIIVYFLEKIGPVKLEGVPAPASVPELWLQIFVIAVLPAICEEFFFRGVLYNALSGLGVKLAIGISSFYFALFHFDLRNLVGPLFLGLLIAWYCYRTGSIFAGVLAHFTNNLLAVIISWANRNLAEDPGPLTPDMMSQFLVAAVVIGSILLILLKAFEAVTKDKHRSLPGEERNLSLSIIIHWPLWIFYSIYLIISGLYIYSLIKPPV